MPYSVCVEGEVLDFYYKKKDKGTSLQKFYIGGIFIGWVAEASKSGWSAVSYHTPCKYGVVYGFKTRYAASEFMLKVCGFVK